MAERSHTGSGAGVGTSRLSLRFFGAGRARGSSTIRGERGRLKRRSAMVAASGEDVLLVGTGLTMVDAMLSLAAAVIAASGRAVSPRANPKSA